jgi:hypothetical protein
MTRVGTRLTRRRVAGVIVAVIAALSGAPAAWAHGGVVTMSVVAANATGPLQSFLRVHAVWQDGDEAGGLTLTVQGSGPPGGIAPVVMQQAAEGDYRATINYPAGGTFQLTVTVAGPDVAPSPPLVVSQTVEGAPPPTAPPATQPPATSPPATPTPTAPPTTTPASSAPQGTAPTAPTALPSAGGVSVPVMLTPRTAPRSSAPVLSVVVPNVQRDSDVVRVEVRFPESTAILHVALRPLTGWNASVVHAPIANPTTNLTERVASIAWTAASGGLQPDQLQIFSFTAGPLPAKGSSILLPVVQTYASGAVLAWDGAAGAGVNRPAPVLVLTRPTKESRAASH